MDNPPPTIDYATPRRSRRFFRPLTRREKVFLLLAPIVFLGLFLVLYLIAKGPTSGQIRLDTGDLRYCWYGIPVEYRQMPEPQRSKILKIAAMSPAVPTEWQTCVTYPLPTSNNPDAGQVCDYLRIAAWADEDPALAKMALTDHVDSLRKMHGPLWIGGGSVLFSVNEFGTDKVETNWRDDPIVQAYCAAHGYVPPPPATTAAATR